MKINYESKIRVPLLCYSTLFIDTRMETFHESAGLMLRQFRTLLHRQPLPMPAARLLQLTALNMFAVETTGSTYKGNVNFYDRIITSCSLILCFRIIIMVCVNCLQKQKKKSRAGLYRVFQ